MAPIDRIAHARSGDDRQRCVDAKARRVCDLELETLQ